MTTIIKAKGFTPELVTFLQPKHVIDSNYVIPIMYDDCVLQVQLPRCVVCNAVYESHGKFYIDVMTPFRSVLMSFVDGLSKRIAEHMKTLTEYNLNNAVIHDHVNRLTTSDDKELFYSLRLKVPRIGQAFQAKITDTSGESKIVTDVKAGSSILCIVSVENCYCMAGRAGFALNASNIKLMDGT